MNKKMQYQIDLQLTGYDKIEEVFNSLKRSGNLTGDMETQLEQVFKKAIEAGKKVKEALKGDGQIDADSFGLGKIQKELSAIINQYLGGLKNAKSVKTENVAKAKEELQAEKDAMTAVKNRLKTNQAGITAQSQKLKEKISKEIQSNEILDKRIKNYDTLKSKIEKLQSKKDDKTASKEELAQLKAYKVIERKVKKQKESVDLSQKQRVELIKEKEELSKTLEKAKNKLSAMRDLQVDVVDNKELRELNKAIKLLEKMESGLNKIETHRQKEEMKAVTKATKNLNKADQEHNRTLMGKVATGLKYYVVLNQLRRLYRSIISTVTELDDALTQVAMVTSMNRKEAWGLIGNYQQLAKEVGMTTTQVAELSIYFFRQGRSAEDAFEMTKVAAKAAKVAAIDATESANYLTSAINGFGMAASQAELVADKFAALGAASASSYEELAKAMSKVAPAARVAGIDIDHMMGFIAKGIETTREAPENIGTAFKTIFSRMRELKDIGKTMEDGMDVNRVETALRSVGVELRDSNGQFRDLQDVINETGAAWDGLTRNQQAYVATALAGTRQQARLLALFQDYDRTLELVEESQDAAGQMAIQHSEYMDGMGAAVDGLKNAWQGFITTITESEAVINIVHFLGDAINFLTSAIAAFTEPAGIMKAVVFGLAATTSILIARKLMLIKAQIIENIATRRAIQLKLKEAATEKMVILWKKMGLRWSIKEALSNYIKAKSQKAVTRQTIKEAFSTRFNTKAKRANVAATGGVVAANGALIPMLFSSIGATVAASGGFWGLAAAVFAALWPIVLIIAAIAAVIAIGYGLYRMFTRKSRAIKDSAKELRKLNKELANMKKEAKNVQKMADEFEKLNKKIAKTPEDLERIRNLTEELSSIQVGDNEPINLLKLNAQTGKYEIHQESYEKFLEQVTEREDELQEEMSESLFNAMGTAGAEALENDDLSRQYTQYLNHMLQKSVEGVDVGELGDQLSTALSRASQMIDVDEIVASQGDRGKNWLGRLFEFDTAEKDAKYYRDQMNEFEGALSDAYVDMFQSLSEIDYEDSNTPIVENMINGLADAKRQVFENSELSAVEKKQIIEALEIEFSSAQVFTDLKKSGIGTSKLQNLMNAGLSAENISTLQEIAGSSAVNKIGNDSDITPDEILEIMNKAETVTEKARIFDIFSLGDSGDFANEIDQYNKDLDTANELKDKFNKGTITATELLELQNILGNEYTAVMNGQKSIEDVINSRREQGREDLLTQIDILHEMYEGDEENEYYLAQVQGLQAMYDNWEILNEEVLTHKEILEDVKALGDEISKTTTMMNTLESLGLEDSGLYNSLFGSQSMNQALFDEEIGSQMASDVSAVEQSFQKLEDMGLTDNGVVLFDPDGTDEQMAAYDEYQGALDNLQETSEVLVKNIKEQAKAIEQSYKNEISAVKTVNSEKWKTIQYQDKIADLNEKMAETAQRIAGLSRDETAGAELEALQDEQEKLAKQKQKMIEDQLMAEEIAALERERDMQIQQLGEQYVNVTDTLNNTTVKLVDTNVLLEKRIRELIQAFGTGGAPMGPTQSAGYSMGNNFILEMGN